MRGHDYVWYSGKEWRDSGQGTILGIASRDWGIPHNTSEIWDSYGNEDVNCGHLDCEAM